MAHDIFSRARDIAGEGPAAGGFSPPASAQPAKAGNKKLNGGSEMKKYEDLKEKIGGLLGEFSSRDLDEALTLEEFQNLLEIDITDQWEKSINWEANEYDTQDFTFSIDTITEDNKEITIVTVLEVKDNLITHIVNVEEYYS